MSALSPPINVEQPKAATMLEKVRAEAAELRNFTITFLSLLLYVAIIIATTSHEQILRIDPVRLPLLDVEVPIVGFYWFMPGFLFFIHLYILVQHYLFSQLAFRFRAALEVESDHEQLRRSLGNLPFLHWLAGQHTWPMDLLMTTFTVVSLVIWPVWTLWWLQAAFLPYHDNAIVWTQRVFLLLDVASLAYLWAKILHELDHAGHWWAPLLAPLKTIVRWAIGRTRRYSRLSAWLRRRCPRRIADGLRSWLASSNTLSLQELFFDTVSRWSLLMFLGLALFFSFAVSILPDSPEEQWLLARLPDDWIVDVPGTANSHSYSSERRMFKWTAWLHELRPVTVDPNKLNDDYDRALIRRCIEKGTYSSSEVQEKEEICIWANAWFPRNLSLSGKFLVANRELAVEIQFSLDIKAIAAKTNRENLAKAKGLSLRERHLEYADFSQSSLPNVDLYKASLKSADLSEAKLESADLRHAQLPNANLRKSLLFGADLSNAALPNAEISQAKLQGAKLLHTKFFGARLTDTYDLTVEKDHNFVADGIIVHNSHSAAYALVAYQTAWLKAHYPAAFMAAVLSSDMDNTDKVVVLIEECREMKLRICPPNINVSQYRFTVNDSGQIVYGLGAIKGVGEAAIEDMLTERERNGEFSGLLDLCRRVDLRKFNRRVLEALVRAGAFDVFDDNRAAHLAALPVATKIAEQHGKMAETGQNDLFGFAADTDTSADSEEESIYGAYVEPWSEDERLSAEKQTLGLYLTGHPIEQYEPELKQFIPGKIASLPSEPSAFKGKLEVKVAGLVIDIRTRQSKTGKMMAFILLDDRSGRIEVSAFNDTYHKYRELICKDTLLVVEGSLSTDDYTNSVRLSADKLYSIEQARAQYARSLWINWDSRNGSDKTANFHESLKATLQPYCGGSCPVTLQYRSAQAAAMLHLGDRWRIQPSEELLLRLRRLLGVDAVELRYR